MHLMIASLGSAVQAQGNKTTATSDYPSEHNAGLERNMMICGVISLLCTLFTIGFTIYQFLLHRKNFCTPGDTFFSKSNLGRLCGVLLTLSLMLRSAWCFLQPSQDLIGCDGFFQSKKRILDDEKFFCYFLRFVNRLSMLLQMTTVFLILTAWMLALGGGGEFRSRNKMLRIGFIVANVVVYIVVFATSFWHQRYLYTANSFIIAGSALIASILTLVVGLTCVARRLREMTRSKLVQRQFYYVVAVTIICLIAYLIRTACFTYGALYADKVVSQSVHVDIYPWFFYPVPDTMICFCVVGLLFCQRTSHHVAERNHTRASLSAQPGVMAAANAYAQLNAEKENNKLIN